jgi:hypothetical protein
VGNAGNLKVAGAITFAYEDGTEATQYVVQDRNVSGWWYPSLAGSWPGGYGSPRHPPLVKLAWRGRSDVCPNVGIYWYGLDNPHDRPSVPSPSGALDGAIYAVAGPDAGRQPSARSRRRSPSGPDSLGGEGRRLRPRRGLAGVVDRDVAYRVAGVSPRWPAAGTNEAKVVVH